MLYGANTVGAVFGLPAGGLLPAARLRHGDGHVRGGGDQRGGGAGELLAGQAGAGAQAPADEARPACAAGRAGRCTSTIALSGATALGAEVIWTRLLGLMLGATVYTFSIILAVFLVGIGDRQRGRVDAGVAARGIPQALLGWSQMLLAGAIAWTAYMLAQFAALLADQSAALHQPLVHLPDRHGALSVGACCRRRCCGARAFRWRWRRRRARRAIRDGWWAASTRPTRSARLWARWRSA